MKCTRNVLCSYIVSEMKHIQKDYMVKIFIPRESANQNVAIVGERNDEDHAVPSVMKLMEKLTSEEDRFIILKPTLTRLILLSSPLKYQFLRSPKESWYSTGSNPGTSRCTDRQHVRTHTHKVIDCHSWPRFS